MDKIKRKRMLECCVCGSSAGRWQQHYNRDTGYGVCRDCIEWTRKSKHYDPDQEKQNYGIEGVNFAPAMEPRKPVLMECGHAVNDDCLC
jgi:hypothetical protein